MAVGALVFLAGLGSRLRKCEHKVGSHQEFGRVGRCYVQRNSYRTEGIYLSVEVDARSMYQ